MGSCRLIASVVSTTLYVLWNANFQISEALSHRRHVIRDQPLPVRPRLNREQVVVSLVSFVPNLILASNASE